MRERLTFTLTEDPAIADNSNILYKVKNPNIFKAEKDYRNIEGDTLNEKNIKDNDSC
jgi:hypothetical protein